MQSNIECEVKFRFSIADRTDIESVCESIAIPGTVHRYWILDFRFNQHSTGVKGKKSYERIRKQKRDNDIVYFHTIKKIDALGNTNESEVIVSESEAEQIIKKNSYELYKKERLECSVDAVHAGLDQHITLSVDIMPIQKLYCYVECEIMLESTDTDTSIVKQKLVDFMSNTFQSFEHIRQF